jgi:hypothetical protein
MGDTGGAGSGPGGDSGTGPGRLRRWINRIKELAMSRLQPDGSPMPMPLPDPQPEPQGH